MFEHILLAVDGSAQTNNVVEAAAALAKLSNAEVRVLHVREFGFAGRAGQVELEDKAEAHHLVDMRPARSSTK